MFDDLAPWRMLAAADWDYDEAQLWFHQEILHPAIASALVSSGAETVLDFGAGRGHLASHLSSSGFRLDTFEPAMKVTAFSSGRRFTRRAELPGGYDAVVASLVVSAMPDLSEAVKHLAAPVRPGGTVVMAVPHPVFSLLTSVHSTTEREWAPGSPATAGSLGDLSLYFGRHRQLVRWNTAQPIATSLYYRTLEDYIGAFNTAHLTVGQALEPRPASPAGRADLFERFSTIPAFLVLVAGKG